MTRPTETPRVTNLPDRNAYVESLFSRRLLTAHQSASENTILPSQASCLRARRHRASSAPIAHAPQLCLRAAAPSLARTRARDEISAAVQRRRASAASAASARADQSRLPLPRQATRSDRGHMWLFDYLWSMLNALGALQHCSDSHGAVLRLRCCSSRSRCGCARASQVWLTRTPRFSSLAWTMPARRRCCTCSRTSASRSTTRRSIRVRALPDSD